MSWRIRFLARVISVMWVRVHVAMPATVHSSNSVDKSFAAPQYLGAGICASGQHDDLGVVRTDLRAAFAVPGRREGSCDVYSVGLRRGHS
jgi:hypothetical protein